MACPRCETALTTYTFDDQNTVAVVCGKCGFADVPAADDDDEIDQESWDDALDRFSEAISPTGRTQSIPIPEADATDDTAVKKTSEATRVSIDSSVHESESE
jgi:Zn ribbon nucleic-acid-binding protein